jgi:hypothetical protein
MVLIGLRLGIIITFSVTFSAYVYVGLATPVDFAVLHWLEGVRRRAPARIQGFLRRLGLFRERSSEAGAE